MERDGLDLELELELAAGDVVVAAPVAAAASADDDEGTLAVLDEVVDKTKTIAMTDEQVASSAASSQERRRPLVDAVEEAADSDSKVPVVSLVAQIRRRKKKLLVLHLNPFRFFYSSPMLVNVDAAVDMLMEDFKHRLLFSWDASKCTATGLYTLENKNKPLVLKELKKLWSKDEADDGLPWQQGDFSPSKSLLVDDSPYKALGNPPHTAIFPFPYSYKNSKDDSSLGPVGDLRLYLESLAIADDVPRFVREHPFGQPSITESNPNWNFYKRVLLE